MLVKTMLQISRTLVSSSGWVEREAKENKKKKEKKEEKLGERVKCGSGCMESGTKNGRQKIREVKNRAVIDRGRQVQTER